MAKFQTGDKVLVNGSLVAEIHTYDTDADRLVFVAQVGGGTDTTYGHISQYNLAHLATEATGVEDAGDDAPAQGELPIEDAVTTLDTFTKGA